MNRITELKRQKAELIKWKRTLDSSASLQNWEGRMYAEAALKLILINLELDALQKEKAAR